MSSSVLLMAHGTPSSMDEMPEYLRLVRGGRPPSPELIAEMRHNYEAIGGKSPLTELTFVQGAALSRLLGPDIPVAVGMRNWKPFLQQAIDELASRGVTRIIGIPLAPQFSSLSVTKRLETDQFSIRYKCVLVRTISVLPATAGEAIQPPSSLFIANSLNFGAASMTGGRKSPAGWPGSLPNRVPGAAVSGAATGGTEAGQGSRSRPS